MSNTIEMKWTETPSRFRTSVAGACAHASLLPSAIQGGEVVVAGRIAAGDAPRTYGTPAWSPPC